jgi:acyl-CoA reductase-like NAD-dependent aldehyde dehydrogenase
MAKSMQTISNLVKITILENTTFLMGTGKHADCSDAFSYEKLSLLLTPWQYQEFEDAIKIMENITDQNECGHSCGIHSNHQGHNMALATRVKVSRVMVNQAQSLENSGIYNNGLPFNLKLGCGTWGGNKPTENINYRHFMKNTQVSMPIDPIIPDEADNLYSFWKTIDKRCL